MRRWASPAVSLPSPTKRSWLSRTPTAQRSGDTARARLLGGGSAFRLQSRLFSQTADRLCLHPSGRKFRLMGFP